MNGHASVLNSHVLVLNKLWMAIRVDDGSYSGHDFESWAEISAFARSFAGPEYEFVRTVHMQIAVPKVIRLLGYD